MGVKIYSTYFSGALCGWPLDCCVYGSNYILASLPVDCFIVEMKMKLTTELSFTRLNVLQSFAHYFMWLV